MKPASRTIEELKQLILDKSEIIPWTGCWIWLGGRSTTCRNNIKREFGTLYNNNKQLLASHVSYEVYNGPITDGLWVLHHCDVSLCVNPKHLYVGTHIDNMKDMARRNRAAATRKGEFAELSAVSKLTNIQRLEIEQLRKDGLSYQAIANIYGITKQTTWAICKHLVGYVRSC